MLKILGSAAITGTIFSALQTATAPPAGALDRYVELINNSRMAIVEIYPAEVGTGRWQQDVLGDQTLLPAHSALVGFHDGTGCRFDLKIVYDDGTEILRRNVNICRGFVRSVME